MKFRLPILAALVVLWTLGCSPKSGANSYVPSITFLKPDETLEMRYRACHNGCDKAKVKFQNGRATAKGKHVTLTSMEIASLDAYFADTAGDEYFCSMRIEISFKLKRGLRTINKSPTRDYPCVFSQTALLPEQLVYHFNEMPNETPFWRLSREEQAKYLTLDD